MSRPAVQQFAAHYTRNLHLNVVPLAPRAKRAVVNDWRAREFGMDDFSADDNIGIKHANGLVVFDPDTPEAVALADEFLPPTTAIYGRTSAPRAKRLYLCPWLTTPLVFTDTSTKATIFELRTSGQDMAPPSLHPSGERLKWVGPLVLPDVETPEAGMMISLRGLATAALLAHYWPGSGARHKWALAVAGTLRALDVDELVALRAFDSASRYVGDPDARRADVTGTYQGDMRKMQAGVLSELGYAHLVTTLTAIWKPEQAAVHGDIARLNQRYAIINLGVKTVVMERDDDHTILNFYPFDEFRRRLIKRRVTAGRRTRGLADVWLEHPLGLQYDQLIYELPGSSQRCRPDDYNGWRGFTVAPAPGDWSRTRAFIEEVICDGDANACRWVLNWCAALVQLPGRHAYTAIVMRGTQGIGKGTFANDILGKCLHRTHYAHLNGAGQLTGNFNGHLSGKVLVYADEATWGGNREAANRLKHLVTEPVVSIERKFLDQVFEPSMMHVLIASNEDWPVHVEKDDRRYTILDVSDRRRQQFDYFKAVHDELAAGGRAAMLYDLMALALDEAALRTPYATAVKRELALRSMSVHEKWWHEVLSRGGFKLDVGTEYAWHAEVPKNVMQNDYLQHVGEYGRGRSAHATASELGHYLNRWLPGPLVVSRPRSSWSSSVRGTDARPPRCYVLPSLEECRAKWDELFGPQDWTED